MPATAQTKRPSTTKVKVHKYTEPQKKGAELVRTDKEISAEDILSFVREAAGGNPNNVEIVPLDNVDLEGKYPFPFGNGGKENGVRNLIQNMIAYGVDGDRTLGVVLQAAGKLNHSKTKPVCLLATLNGGYSPSSKYWGTSYVKLRVKRETTTTQ